MCVSVWAPLYDEHFLRWPALPEWQFSKMAFLLTELIYLVLKVQILLWNYPTIWPHTAPISFVLPWNFYLMPSAAGDSFIVMG